MSSRDITQVRVRNAESQSLPQTYRTRTCSLTRCPKWFVCILNLRSSDVAEIQNSWRIWQAEVAISAGHWGYVPQTVRNVVLKPQKEKLKRKRASSPKCLWGWTRSWWGHLWWVLGSPITGVKEGTPSWRRKGGCLGWWGSVDWVLACKARGCQFDSQSGHMPGLWARSLVGGTHKATTHWCFSPSLSSSLPF